MLLVEQDPVAGKEASRVPTILSNLFSNDSAAAHWWPVPMAHADNRSLEVMRGEDLVRMTWTNSIFFYER